MGVLTIGGVAERAGIAASAIRYYEREGLLPHAARRNGRRVYGEEILARLAAIDLAKRAGFTIAEIRRLLGGAGRPLPRGARWRRLAAEKRAELDARIGEARRTRALLALLSRCTCASLDDCARALRAAGPPPPAP